MKKKQFAAAKLLSILTCFYPFYFLYFFKKVLQKHKHIKPGMLSLALAFASMALNISHARIRLYMFASRLFFIHFF